MSDMEDTFTKINHDHYWSGDTPSGPGSSLAATRFLRKLLPVICQEYIRSNGVLLDAPCGDWNWMQHVDLPGVMYIGVDIVKSMIASNIGAYSSPRVSFIYGDICTMKLPLADMVMARHFFQHINPTNAENALENFRSTGAEYLLATTYIQQNPGAASDGGFYPYDLRQFGVGLPLAEFPAVNSTYPDERLGLWKLK